MYKQHGESSSTGASSSNQLITPSLMSTSSLIASPRESAPHRNNSNTRPPSISLPSQDSHVHNRHLSHESSSTTHNDYYYSGNTDPDKRWRAGPHKRIRAGSSSSEKKYVDGDTDMPICEEEAREREKDKRPKKDINSGKTLSHSVVPSSRAFSGTSSYRKDNHVVNSPISITSISDSDDNETSSSTSSDSENNKGEVTSPKISSDKPNAMLFQGEIYDLLHDIQRSRSRHNIYAEKAKKQAKIFKRSARELERKLRAYAASLGPALVPPPISPTIPISTVIAEKTSTSIHPSNSKSTSTLISSRSMKSSATLTKGTRSISSNSNTDIPSNPSFASSSNSNGLFIAKKTNATIKSQIGTNKTSAILDSPQPDRSSTPLPYKPRSLLLHSSSKFANLDPTSWGVRSDSSLISNLIVSTTIRGDIRLWDGRDRRIIADISCSKFGSKTKSEDAAWLSPSTLIMDIQYEASTEPGDIILLHVVGASKQSIVYRTQKLDGDSPHGAGTKGITQLEPVQCRSNSDGGQSVLFATGGKNSSGKETTVVLWSIERPDSSSDYKLLNHKVLHTRHTSNIHGFFFDTEQQMLWSCGVDRRLVKWDLKKEMVAGEAKLLERLNSITQNPVDTNLLLLSKQSFHNQLSLIDTRKSPTSGEILNFGYKGIDNVSRYLSPAWHPNGYLVAMGHQSEATVNIWDIRYTGPNKDPAQKIPNLHTHKVLRVDFMRNKSNTLVSCSSDRTVSFTNYTLAESG